jgi:hypothetical protein
MQMEEAKNKTNLATYRDLAFLIAIYLYFAGWIYVYYYFDYFGISIKQIDIEVYYLFIYSSNIFIYCKTGWIIATCVFFILLISNYFYRKRIPEKLKRTVVIAILIISFPCIYSISKKAALYNAQDDWKNPDLPVISFQFKKVFLDRDTIINKPDQAKDLYYFSTVFSKSQKELLLSLSHDQKLRLLYTNGERYFVLCIIESNRFWPVVLEVPKENIEFAYIHKSI